MKRLSFFSLFLLFATSLMAQTAATNLHNGHEYVDLGLPSGTLWATCNIGATTPEQYGDYFAWGETTTKAHYDWTTYQHGKAYNALTKYCANNTYGANGYTDKKTILDVSDDAAVAHWGNAWRTPTAADFQELQEHCTWEWTTQSDVQGYKVTGKNGNAIFLPAAGYRYDAELAGVGKYGYYLSSSSNTSYPNHAHYTYFRSEKQEGSHISRYYGQTIRPVQSGKQDEPIANAKISIKKGKNKRSFTINGVTFNMIYVHGGTFTMGATPEQGSDARDNEKPAHQVTLSDYYIGETEVTQALWETVMGNNPSYFKGIDKPVEWVSWDDCQEFIRKLNALTGATFRLPTEAEWEYAARGSKKSKGYKYSGSNYIDDVAWYDGNDDGKGSATYGTKPVAMAKPNELGIYDMSGNVFEWCSDWENDYDGSSSQVDPQGPSSGVCRMLRGGCWSVYTSYCRVSSRIGFPPSSRGNYFGLRIVLVP